MIDFIRRTVSESLELKKSFFAAHEETVAALAREICRALENGNKVVLFGNGGSAADAQHIAGEWIGRFQKERRGLPALALTTDTSVLTAVGNDYGFEQVFARQVRALGGKGDVAIALSTSGNSPNVLLGVAAANELGMVTAALTGGDGGRLGPMVRYHLRVPHASTARVQEVHIMIAHILCGLVDEHLKGL
jgi:D-sedoheptulose 7-phosphate isomerase